MTSRARFAVTGIVQGVGFRPFLHRLARHHGLVGFVRNTGHGVLGEAEGEKDAVDAFLAARSDQSTLPPLAVVSDVETE